MNTVTLTLRLTMAPVPGYKPGWPVEAIATELLALPPETRVVNIQSVRRIRPDFGRINIQKDKTGTK